MGFAPVRHGDGVLVSGAGGPLHRAVAIALASGAYRVTAEVAEPTEEEGLRRVAEEAGVTDRLRYACLHLDDEGALPAAIAALRDESCGLAGLVNVLEAPRARAFEDCDEEEIRATVEASVFRPLAVTRAVLPLMRATGRGRVVTVGSRLARAGLAGHGADSLAQHALAGWTESLAMELMPFGLTASLVEPSRLPSWTLLADPPPTSGRRSVITPSSALDARDRAWESHDGVAHVLDAVVHALRDPRPRFHYPAAPRTGMLQRLVPAGFARRSGPPVVEPEAA